MTVQYVSDPHIICVQFECKRIGYVLSACKSGTNCEECAVTCLIKSVSALSNLRSYAAITWTDEGRC